MFRLDDLDKLMMKKIKLNVASSRSNCIQLNQ